MRRGRTRAVDCTCARAARRVQVRKGDRTGSLVGEVERHRDDDHPGNHCEHERHRPPLPTQHSPVHEGEILQRSQGEPCRVPPTPRRSTSPSERGPSTRELRSGFAPLTPSGEEESLGDDGTPGGARGMRVAAGASPAAKGTREPFQVPLRRVAQRRLANATHRCAGCAPESRR